MQSLVPFGADISSISTDPHFPFTLNGMLCGVPHPHCQDPHPLLIFIKFNFAFLNAFSLEGTVSRDFPYPIPTKPFLFPTTAIVANLGLFPSLVFFCVCLKTLFCPPPNLPFY